MVNYTKFKYQKKIATIPRLIWAQALRPYSKSTNIVGAQALRPYRCMNFWKWYYFT